MKSLLKSLVRFRLGPVAGVALLGNPLFLVSCAGPLEAPPAFEEQPFLCGSEHAEEYGRAVEQCREAHFRDGSCKGIISMRGVLDRQPTALTSTMDRAVHLDTKIAGEPSDRSFNFGGAGPYYTFVLNVGSFAVPPATTESGPLPDGACNNPTSGMGRCDVMNLEARGGNYLLRLVSIVRHVDVETEDEIGLSMTASTSDGLGHLELCLDAFP